MSEIIVCTNCGSKYLMDYNRVPMKDKDTLNCEVCGEEYYSWNEAKIWYGKLIERHEDHIDRQKNNGGFYSEGEEMRPLS